MKKKKVVAIMGMSGSGKDTLAKELIKRMPNELHEIVSYTTRPIRENEVEGKDYFFVTEDEFLHKINSNEMIEYSVFNNWYYGCAVDALSADSINIGVFNPTGVRSLLSKDNLDVMVVYLTAEDKNRLLRQLKREDNPNVDEIVRRYGTDKQDFSAIDFNYFELVNNSIMDLAINLGILSSKIRTF